MTLDLHFSFKLTDRSMATNTVCMDDKNGVKFNCASVIQGAHHVPHRI